MPENRFNLIEEAWIPVASEGKKSLHEIFSGEGTALGGTAREKIALLKLLLAIAQAAATPENSRAWLAMGPQGLGEMCVQYLKDHHAAFYLYGEKPFLQMPVQKAKKKSYSVFLPHIATGNTTRLTQLQREYPLDDAERALLLVCEMSMCLGGKKPDYKFKLDAGVEKKTPPPGPGMGANGLQHSFLLGKTILESLWLNLLDEEGIKGLAVFSKGLGIPPWEKMPQTENCYRANELKDSLIGRLVPLARYCLLAEDGIHSTEGIRHPDYSSNIVDPSVAMNKENAKTQVIWINPEKRPWRSLAGMLAFLDANRPNYKFDCVYLDQGIKRLIHIRKKCPFITHAHIWCGGLKTSSQSGETAPRGNDDCVESDFSILLEDMNEFWYGKFADEMKQWEEFSEHLKKSVKSYLDAQKMNNSGVKIAENLFWDTAETYFQELLDTCKNEENIKNINNKIKAAVREIYNSVCPHETARQLDNWAEFLPFGRNWKKGKKTAKSSEPKKEAVKNA